MNLSWTRAVVALIVTAGTAGCFGGDEAPGIDVTPSEDPVTQPYLFKARGAADNFTWDFGDASPRVSGKEVEHLFGFTDGEVTVTLFAQTGDDSTSYTQTLQFGTGQNTPPALAMEASSNWATVGESITFSGASSTDADNDPLLFSWIRIRKGDLEPAGGDGHGHEHGGGGGVPFPTGGGAAPLKGTLANGTLPEATMTVDDLCGTFDGSDTTPSRDSTISGAFTAPGVYTITMLGRDPKSPTVAADFMVYVSETRPAAVFERTFDGTFEGGSGDAQQIGDALGRTFNQASHSFSLPIVNTFAVITLSHDGGTVPGASVTFMLLQSGGLIGSDEGGVLEVAALPAGEYRIDVQLENGIDVDYEITVVGQQDLDPGHLYVTS